MARKAKGKDDLGEYARRRDFAKTKEPAAKPKVKKGSRAKSKQPRFVVQQHSARRLHWDLRLEHEGVAASWAIPNGIPVDPEENRKAVHTEDHPLEYLEWEGEIPKGEYGAGTMRIWDRGTFAVEKWTESKVVVDFTGERLSGRYALFRAGRAEKDWMIHRIDPPAERRDPFPDSLAPMLTRPGPLPEDEEEWAVELRWDGVRAVAFCQPGRLRLQSRELEDITSLYPQVRRLSRQIGSRDAVLDGMLVAFEGYPVTYVIFDLVHLDGQDLGGEPYRRRRELLEELGLEGESWQTPHYARGQARELLAAADERGLGGIVLKRIESGYAPGMRDGSWLEVAAAPDPAAWDAPLASASRVVPEGGPRKRARVEVEGRELSLSNLDKVLYPKTGFSKGELIEWYAQIADVLLPHLRGRPLTLKRYPDGVESSHFYEKRCPGHRPEWVQTARVWSERHDEEIDYCLVEDLPTLVWAANLADIELHTSLAHAAAIERPAAVVFDLDPGAPADVLDCAQVALWIRGMFEQLGLHCYPKTSGSKGMQIYLPLNTEVSYEQTKPFGRAVAETLESKFPEHVVSRMTKSQRTGRVLVDWSQNDQHKTTVCVYSLRAKERPTVSTPLAWEEVEAALDAADATRLFFDPAEVLRRVAERGDLFAPLLSEKQQLPD
jgi:bifunctional non-homologous end joining protein LigD